MGTVKCKIGVAPLDFAGTSNLALAVISGLTANANFTTPLVPIVNLSIAQVSLDNAIATWGPVGNRGSHADYQDLKTKCNFMRSLLLAEAGYVDSIVALIPDTPTQLAVLVTSGFAARRFPAPQGLLGQPENLHREMSSFISEDNIMLNWEKPTGLTSPGNVKSYRVFESILGEIGIVTATKMLITTGISHGNTYHFHIVGTNTNGNGAPSAVLTVNF